MALQQHCKLLLLLLTTMTAFLLANKASVAYAESELDSKSSVALENVVHVSDSTDGSIVHSYRHSYYNVSLQTGSVYNVTLHSRHTRQMSEAGYRLTLGR